MRSLGLDIGDKRIGVAVSDIQGILATPFSVINRSDQNDDIEAIIEIVRHKEAGIVIVGLPRTMEGNIGEQAEKVNYFVDELRKCLDVPIEYRDERWSTVTARRLIKDSGTRKRAKKEPDDDIAAAVILQSYLGEKDIR